MDILRYPKCLDYDDLISGDNIEMLYCVNDKLMGNEQRMHVDSKLSPDMILSLCEKQEVQRAICHDFLVKEFVHISGNIETMNITHKSKNMVVVSFVVMDGRKICIESMLYSID